MSFSEILHLEQVVFGVVRANLEETGMGCNPKVDIIRAGRDLVKLTCPYVFTPEEARAMEEAGADVLVPQMGLTTSGTIGVQTAVTFDDSVARVQAMHGAAKAIDPEVVVLCHGAPIAEPDDAAYVLKHSEGIVGIFEASSAERLPVETAIADNARHFEEIKVTVTGNQGKR